MVSGVVTATNTPRTPDTCSPHPVSPHVTFSGGGDLLGEAGDDAAGGVVLVQRMGQFLACGLELLAQREAVQHDGVLGDRQSWAGKSVGRERHRLGANPGGSFVPLTTTRPLRC